MALLIFYVVLALGVSFLCSIMEAVLLSVSPSFVVRLEGQHPAVGHRLRRLKDDVDRPLAAILSLNTIAHTVGAAGAGAQAATVYGDASLGLISAVLTFLILVVSEIIPKTLGAVYWRQLTPAVIRLLVPTVWLMWPLVKMAQGLTRLLARRGRKAGVEREDLRALAELGAREGVLHASESRILKNLFRFDRIRARDIMTPRTVLFALPQDLTVAEVVAAHPGLPFSRIPIYEDNRDAMTGFVLKGDILQRAVRQQGGTRLHELQRPLAAVPESLSLRRLFEKLLEESAHVALVVDEYGGTDGLVTLEDLLETLLGLEIVDEADPAEDMRALAAKLWQQRARRLGIVSEGEDSPPR